MKNLRRLIAVITAAVLVLPLAASGVQAKTTNQWTAIKKEGKLVVGTESAYSPFAYYDDDNKLTGFDVEVAKAIGDELGLDVEFVTSDWDGLIAGLDANKYDVVMDQISITSARKKKYAFSTPYTYSYSALIVSEDNDDIDSFDDLDGLTTAQTTTSNWGKMAKKNGATIKEVSGFSEAIQLVEQGRADATINDNVTYLDYKNQQPDAKVKVAALSTDVSRSAVMIRKSGSSTLRKKINAALKNLQEDGTLSEISNKYFGSDVTQADS